MKSLLTVFVMALMARTSRSQSLAESVNASTISTELSTITDSDPDIILESTSIVHGTGGTRVLAIRKDGNDVSRVYEFDVASGTVSSGFPIADSAAFNDVNSVDVVSDAAGTMAYVFNEDGSVVVLNLNTQTKTTTLQITGVTKIETGTIDRVNNKLYYYEEASDMIGRMDLDGNNQEWLSVDKPALSAGDEFSHMEVLPSGNIYFAQDCALFKMSLTNLTAVEVAGEMGSCSGNQFGTHSEGTRLYFPRQFQVTADESYIYMSHLHRIIRLDVANDYNKESVIGTGSFSNNLKLHPEWKLGSETRINQPGGVVFDETETYPTTLVFVAGRDGGVFKGTLEPTTDSPTSSPTTASPTLSPTATPTTSPTNSPTPLGCNAKVLAAVDRTYRRKPADKAQEILSALSQVNNALQYGDLTFGLVAVLQYQVKWLLRMDNPDAQDQTQVGNMISTSIVGGWKHRASNFWPLFTIKYGNLVADPSMPGAILLFTDGQLLRRRHWGRFKKRKAKMMKALGNQMPLIICWRIGSRKTSRFLSAVCDHVVYTGMGSKTEAQVAADVEQLICSVD